MGDALELIKSRRSIRAFTAEPIADGQLRAMLEAAMAAPSAGDRRPWEFIVVTSAEARQTLAQTHRFSGMCARAPVVVAVCGRERISRHWVQDCSAATENLLLEAASLGLGAVWIGIHPSEEHERRLGEVLGLPADLLPLCLVAIGHPAEQKPPRTRFEASRVHHERYGRHEASL